MKLLTGGRNVLTTEGERSRQLLQFAPRNGALDIPEIAISEFEIVVSLISQRDVVFTCVTGHW
jgi:hypothetical protein